MKLKAIICVLIVVLESFTQGLPFGDTQLSGVADVEDPSVTLNRDKRTLTTICVEIKPSSPYEEPYFMCKGTESQGYSKGSGSYPSKVNYKPSKPSSYSSEDSDSYHPGGVKGYHSSSKPEYHVEISKYDKPPTSSYESPKEYTLPLKPSYDKHSSYDLHVDPHSDSYSHYEAPAKSSPHAPASYSNYHENDDGYSKPHPVHKVITYEKPAAPTYSSNPHSYSHDHDYDHHQTPMEYSKPNSYENHSSSGGYSKPSSSTYEQQHSEYSKPSSYGHSTNTETHSKPSYGEHPGNSYNSAPQTKTVYSKPSSYPMKQTAYDQADHSHYESPKPTYSDKAPSTHNAKPTQDYGKSTSTYGQNQHPQQSSGYAAHQAHSYRMIPEELMQPALEPVQPEGFGYRSYGPPMEYQRQDTPRTMNLDSQLNNNMEGPLRFDLSGVEQQDPTLQSAYPQNSYSAPNPLVSSYAPQYAAPQASYPAAPYAPAAPSYVPVHQAPAYVPIPAPAPAAVPYHPPRFNPAPPCPQSYLYSYQPVVIPVPCLSGSYGLPTYGQSLGAPANLNPLHEPKNASPRSENNSESNNTSAEESEETHENEKKSEDQDESKSSKKTENSKKSSAELKEEKPQAESESSKEQVVGAGAAEKPIQETQSSQSGAAPAPAAPVKTSTEVPNTKEAYQAMIKMARIAAQLRRGSDSSTKAADSGSEGAQGTGSVSKAK